VESAACRCQGGSFNYPRENMGRLSAGAICSADLPPKPASVIGLNLPNKDPSFLDGALPFLGRRRDHFAMELLRLSPH
jgi:hypothetical protein